MSGVGAKRPVILKYLLVRNTAITQAALVEHVTPYRQAVRDHAHQFDIATFGGRAALAQMVTMQAESVAFIDGFKLMMIVSLLAIPLVMLVQQPRRSAWKSTPRDVIPHRIRRRAVR
jgi:DHA2 family multidrug resistance protein